MKLGQDFLLRKFLIIVFVINNLSFVVKSAAILLVRILLVPFLFILHEDLFSFSYRQLGYSIIADKLKENTDSDEELLKQYPKTKWKDPANYILAEAHRLLGNNLSARYYYNKSRRPYYGSANKLFNMDL